MFSIAVFSIGLLALLPFGALPASRALVAARLDLVLWALVAGELAVLVALSRISTGAWVNYALQAAVLASVLTARALTRVADEVDRPGMLIPVVLAALVVLLAAVRSTFESVAQRRYERIALAYVMQQVRRPPSEFFFAGRPGCNRVHGQIELVYDEWLYPVFESVHLAEPRSNWLRNALTSGAIRFVVNGSGGPRIEGIAETLPQLGYVRQFHAGPFFVWERIARPSVNRADRPTIER